MMYNHIVDLESPVNNADLIAIERRFGFSFPDTVRMHYLAFNGGRPVKNLFQKDGEYFQIQEFLPIKHGRAGCRFEDAYQDLVIDTPEFPKYLMPIAVDPGGDYYCVSMRPRDVECIYCHVHEYFDDPDRAVIYLARSINEFLNGMSAAEE